MLVTVARVHGETDWRLILGPEAAREEHIALVKSVQFASQHRTYAEIAHFNQVSTHRGFTPILGTDVDSSSSESSSPSSSSTAASVTSSSSSSSSS